MTHFWRFCLQKILQPSKTVPQLRTECRNISFYKRHFTLNPWYSNWKRKKRQPLNSAEKIAYPHAKKMKLDPYLSPCPQNDSKWVKDLKIRPGTLKLLEKNIHKTLSGLRQSKDVLKRTGNNLKNWQEGDKKLNNKDLVTQVKRQHAKWKTLLTTHQTGDWYLITKWANEVLLVSQV